MKLVEWNRLDTHARRAVLARPAQDRNRERADRVATIIGEVKCGGDKALRKLTELLDKCRIDGLAVPAQAFADAQTTLPPAVKTALGEAYERIRTFHRACAPCHARIETAPGVLCEQVSRPVRRVGLYVPAGSAPLPSTALMLGVPARLAGCRDVVLCTPPRPDGGVDPAVLYAASLCGITRIFRLGGVSAIAAMAFGTGSVPRCDKLFGPGNAWVTEAKQQVAAEPGGPAIDLPAGPSEVLVIADAAADPRFVAADLLSQAEHGADSQVLLVTDAESLAHAVIEELERQVSKLSREATARQALEAGRAVHVDSLAQAVEVSNVYAPEHLVLNVGNPRELLERVESAGSVFLGAWSPESAGDYCSGTNHVLPTYGYARAWSGVSVASFLKQITVQELSAEGLRGIGDCAVTLAEAEGLDAHARAISLRLAALERIA